MSEKKDIQDNQLINIADYANIDTLKTLFKLYRYLESEGERGNQTALVIKIDLDTALEKMGPDFCDIIYNILICQDTYREYASDKKVSFLTIQSSLNNALRTAQNILEGGSYDDI